MARIWKTARRSIELGARTLIMGVLNTTPDSFSDGGLFDSVDRALAHAERMVAEGADIIDIGGESPRPGSSPVPVEEELRRTIPVVARLAKIFDLPLSIDTTKAEVARAALDAGVEIINDISGLRFDPRLADTAARTGAGLVLMHSRGDRASLHAQPPSEDIFAEVIAGLRQSIAEAERHGVARAQIVLDPGIGFGKTAMQNVELIARLDRLAGEFREFPLLVGPSRKSFIGHLLNGAPVDQRLHGTMATVAISIFLGAAIVRVHDVRAAVETARVADALRQIVAESYKCA